MHLTIVRRLLPALLLSTSIACAQAPAATAGPVLQRYEIPSAKVQEAVMMQRDFAPGEASGAHFHNGVEIAYLVKGQLEVHVAGQPARTIHAGESFQVPRETPHEAKNTGDTTAQLIITFIIDKGSPLRTPLKDLNTPVATAKPLPPAASRNSKG